MKEVLMPVWTGRFLKKPFFPPLVDFSLIIDMPLKDLEPWYFWNTNPPLAVREHYSTDFAKANLIVITRG